MKYPIIHIGKSSDPDLNGKSFVGVSRFGDSDKVSIVVPYGVYLDDEIDDTNEGQKEQYTFLRRYVKAVQKALTSKHTKERLEEKAGIHNPIAAVNLLHDYLSMGKFVEYEQVSELTERGKIDFNQTIKKVRPTIVADSFYYDQYITRKRVIKEDSFVAQVQCNVINDFMDHGGVVLFGQSISIPVAKVKLNDLTITKLRKELSNTFNSRKENIIRWCISYIEGMRNLNEEEKDGGTWKYAIIASTFWEVMVDSVLSNQEEKDKNKYGKQYEFTYFDHRAPEKGGITEHDTIYEDEEKLIIIDAKMYGSPWDLLSEKVLGKQFGYYEQAKLMKERAGESKKIVNILLTPQIKPDYPYFQNRIILDPHTSTEQDPYKIIYIYNYPAKDLIDDYYYGRKTYDTLIEQFKRLIQDPGVEMFLDQRGVHYGFANMPDVDHYEPWSPTPIEE